MRFELPAACAQSLKAGAVEIGLVPVIEMFRQKLCVVSDVCISSHGPVRSIFLLHRGPVERIRSVALDSSSRTSVALTKIILAERYGVSQIHECDAAPDAPAMLALADAALIIGDPALRLNLTNGDFNVLDLGAEWRTLTGLPMVYAVWAAQRPFKDAELFRHSYEYGRARIQEIVKREAFERQVSAELAENYLTRCIQYDLSPHAQEGLREFQRLAEKHGLLEIDSVPAEVL